MEVIQTTTIKQEQPANLADEAPRVIVVTGSNKGIGYGITENILKNRPTWKIVMTSRTPSNGTNAIAQLKEQFPDADSRIQLIQLDLLSKESINNFVTQLKELYPQGVDVHINNAGVAFRGKMNAEMIDKTMDTNFYKTIELTEALLKAGLIKPQGKVINISSTLGRLKRLSKRNPEALEFLSGYKEGKVALEGLFELVERCGEELKDIKMSRNWPGSVYGLTKLYLSIWTYLRSRAEDLLGSKTQLYCCCPGWCKTDLTKGTKAPNTIQDGALTPCYLAYELPFELDLEKQGKFFFEKKINAL